MLITLSAVVFAVNASQDDSVPALHEDGFEEGALLDEAELLAPEKGARAQSRLPAGKFWGTKYNPWGGRKYGREKGARQVSIGSGNGRVGNIRGVNVRGGGRVSVGSNNLLAGDISGVNVGGGWPSFNPAPHPPSWPAPSPFPSFFPADPSPSPFGTSIGSHNGVVGDISNIWAGRRLEDDEETDDRRRQVSIGSGNGRVGNIRGVNVRGGGRGVSVGSNNGIAGDISGVNVGGGWPSFSPSFFPAGPSPSQFPSFFPAGPSPSPFGTSIGSHNGIVGDISNIWAGRRLEDDDETDDRRRQVMIGSGNGRVGNIRGVNVRGGGRGVSVGSNNGIAGDISGVNVGGGWPSFSPSFFPAGPSPSQFPSQFGPTSIGSNNGFVGDISNIWAGRRLEKDARQVSIGSGNGRVGNIRGINVRGGGRGVSVGSNNLYAGDISGVNVGGGWPSFSPSFFPAPSPSQWGPTSIGSNNGVVGDISNVWAGRRLPNDKDDLEAEDAEESTEEDDLDLDADDAEELEKEE